MHYLPRLIKIKRQRQITSTEIRGIAYIFVNLSMKVCYLTKYFALYYLGINWNNFNISFDRLYIDIIFYLTYRNEHLLFTNRNQYFAIFWHILSYHINKSHSIVLCINCKLSPYEDSHFDTKFMFIALK